MHGFYLEGAAWEEGRGDDEGNLKDAIKNDLHPMTPVMNAYAIHSDKENWDDMYKCPVYMTGQRGADYVFSANIRIDMDEGPYAVSRWVLAGVALLLSLEN